MPVHIVEKGKGSMAENGRRLIRSGAFQKLKGK